MRALVLGCAFLAASFAQSVEAQTPAERYVKSDYARQSLQQYIDLESLKNQIRVQSPDLDEATIERAAIISQEEYAKIVPDIERAYAQVLTDLFTDDELLAILEFLASPVGKTFVEKNPLLMRRGEEAVWPFIEQAYRAIEARYQTEFAQE